MRSFEPSRQRVLEFLRKHKVRYVRNVVNDIGGKFDSVLEIDVTRVESVKLSSRVTLEEIESLVSKIYEDTGLRVGYLLVSVDDDPLTTKLLTAILENNGYLLSDIAIASISNKKDVVYITLIQESDKKLDMMHVKQLINNQFSLLSASKPQVIVDIEKSSPTDAMVLSTLRICSPVAIDELVRELKTQVLQEIDEVWTKRAIGRLRKRNMVGWNATSETYFVTLTGLRAISGPRGHDSLDVRRALTLGKKKW